MCAPGVMQMAQVGAAGYSAYASIKAGNEQGVILDHNADLADKEKRDALERGSIESGAIRQQGNAATARMIAATGANGVDTSVGTPASAIAGSHANTEVDRARVLANAGREAWGFSIEAQNYQSAANRARRAGFLGAIGGLFDATGSFASGAAQNTADQIRRARQNLNG